MKLPLTVIILTFNEEKNLDECLESVIDIAEEIFIVDSFSTDKTLEIAKKYDCNVIQHKFINHSKQLNWTLENLPIQTEWIMRLDADERITPELIEELKENLKNISEGISGLYIKRRVYFMDRWIKYGGYYPTLLLRIWRNGIGRCEDRWMDEHIVLSKGKKYYLKNDMIDKNNKALTWWINKHNGYATREALDLLNIKYHFFSTDINTSISGSDEQKKRWVKENLYSKSPLFLRTFIYFIYRYIFKLGFLDGREGLIWHFLQGFWYRFLVDAKIYEIELKANKENKSIKKVVKELYDMEI